MFGSSAESGATPTLLPEGFIQETVFGGLINPATLRFAPDGRVFVAEKSGLIKVFDSLSDPTATVYADLRTNVYNFWDRGLLGMALPPDFATDPYIYVLYAHDALIGGQAPLWGSPGVSSDPCPTPPGPTADGCVISGRLSRVPASGPSGGAEQVLIENWCQQYPSHSTGALNFGPDGALYLSAGDGASFTFVDFGQDGSPVNPCADPASQGGALRSQDLRTSSDPTGLDGTILRVDPDTGNALPTNPLFGGAIADDDRIIASGLRNPFRFTIRPGSGEVWVADVGWNDYEEINRIPLPIDPTVDNLGWPCYEGSGRQGGYDAANLSICETLYGQPGAVASPFFSYHHNAKVVPGETCPTGSSSVAGLTFYPSGPFPPQYDGALFFSDYSRDCIWVMFQGVGGNPDPATRITFQAGASNPVDVQLGPDGNIYYVDFDGGTIRRIRYLLANQPPVAVIEADPESGPAPLSVDLDGTGSSDPDPGDTLTYAWDLDEDGQFDDSTASQLTYVFTDPGSYAVGLRVSDGEDTDTESVLINAGNDPPQAVIDTPLPTDTWEVGETVGFSGHASDPQEGQLPATSLTWSLVMHHCPSTCHTHPIQDFPNVAGGQFVAPDHDYPSHLELILIATDGEGVQDSASVLIQPSTVQLTFDTAPSGLQLGVGSETAVAPVVRTVIVGSANSVSAVRSSSAAARPTARVPACSAPG